MVAERRVNPPRQDGAGVPKEGAPRRRNREGLHGHPLNLGVRVPSLHSTFPDALFCCSCHVTLPPGFSHGCRAWPQACCSSPALGIRFPVGSLFPGMGSETPTPTSGVCFEIGEKKKNWFLSRGNFPDSPSKLAGRHRGKGRRSWLSGRVNHLCAVSGTKGLEESTAQPGNRGGLSPARNVTGLSRVCYITSRRGLDATHSFHSKWFGVQLLNSDNLGWDLHSPPDYL